MNNNYKETVGFFYKLASLFSFSPPTLLLVFREFSTEITETLLDLTLVLGTRP